jgi:hypothetical protein
MISSVVERTTVLWEMLQAGMLYLLAKPQISRTPRSISSSEAAIEMRI